MSDFDDDEGFGLGEEGNKIEDSKPAGSEAINKAEIVEALEPEEEDIYGDIDGQSDRQLALVERQNSGKLASSSASAPIKPLPAKPQKKGVLPKILADTTIVYVGELEWWTTDAELETICSEFGQVENLTFFEDKASGKSKGYCLVKFQNKEGANMCRHQMHGMVINGRKCVVTFSNNKNSFTKNTQQQTNAHPATAPRGSHFNPQVDPGIGAEFPPLPPWGMGLPMPGGLAMPPFMGLGSQASEHDYKRRRY